MKYRVIGTDHIVQATIESNSGLNVFCRGLVNNTGNANIFDCPPVDRVSLKI
jgi:hypothetical protein